MNTHSLIHKIYPTHIRLVSLHSLLHSVFIQQKQSRFRSVCRRFLPDARSLSGFSAPQNAKQPQTANKYRFTVFMIIIIISIILYHYGYDDNFPL